jgi:hypothetical protein
VQTPEPDWFPSRIDLRGARRWERTRLAVIGNLLFLGCASLFSWFDVPKSEGFFVVALLGGFALAASLQFHSFVRIAAREQLEDLAKRLGLIGCHVTCQFFEGDFEIGSDCGYLARDGGMLRFEGATSRFVISKASLTREPDLEVRKPVLELETMRIQIKPDRDTDVDHTSFYLNRWLREGGPISEERLPPRTPQKRSWSWYLERAVERHAVVISFAMLATHFRLLFPESLKELRLFIFGMPVAALAVFMVRTAAKLREEDREQLAERTKTAEFPPEANVVLPVEIPRNVTAG